MPLGTYRNLTFGRKRKKEWNWTGSAGDSNWLSPANWDIGVSYPKTKNDTVIFDSTSNSVDIPSFVGNLENLSLRSQFTGVVTLNNEISLQDTLRIESGLFDIKGYPVQIDRYEQSGGTLRGTNGQVILREFQITGGTRTDTATRTQIKFNMTGVGGISATVGTNLTIVFTDGCVTTLDSVISAGGFRILGYLFKSGSTVKTLANRTLDRFNGGFDGTVPEPSIIAEEGANFDLHQNGGLSFRVFNSSHGISGAFPGCSFVVQSAVGNGIQLLGDALCWNMSASGLNKRLILRGYDLTVQNNLSFATSSSIFDASSGDVFIGKDMSVAIFTSATGQRTFFNGDSQQTISLGGNTASELEVLNDTAPVIFNQEFSCSNFVGVQPGSDIRFQSGLTFDIGSLEIEGSPKSLVNVSRNGGSGSDRFNLVVQTPSVSYAEISNCNAVVPFTATDSVDGGNNIGITFA